MNKREKKNFCWEYLKLIFFALVAAFWATTTCDRKVFMRFAISWNRETVISFVVTFHEIFSCSSVGQAQDEVQ